MNLETNGKESGKNLESLKGTKELAAGIEKGILHSFYSTLFFQQFSSDSQ
jgi:hypothetical protein